MSLRYYIDHPTPGRKGHPNPLLISGWFMDEQGYAARQIRVRVGKRLVICPRIDRPDIISAIPPGELQELCLGFALKLKTGQGFKLIYIEAETRDGRILLLTRRLFWMPKAQKGFLPDPPKPTPWAQGQRTFITPTLGPQLGVPPTHTAKESKSITVVIPIYNAADHLERCLQSLNAHLAPEHDVILIDDCSPDPRIGEISRAFLAGRPHARYERNLVNLGFVGSCNRAVQELDQTNNDILLLNSDTELTDRAIEELRDVQALSDRHFAVCPRSNKATVLSFPRLAPVSAGDSYALWQNLHKKLPRYQVIPTGVGFCVLLRRNLLQLFGFFDTAYGRGYNEENDLMARANRFGYSCIAANHAFVFHHEGMSFNSERNILEAQNRQILLTRYPEYGRHDRFWYDLQTSLHERFAKSPSSKPTVLFDFSCLQSGHNGSSVYCKQVLRGTLPALCKVADVTVWTNVSAAIFHRSELSGIANLRTTQPRPDETFDLVFVPMQVWDPVQLASCFKYAPRVLWTLFDIISLRSLYLFDPLRWATLRTALRLADEVFTISDYTKEDVLAFFGPLTKMRSIHIGRLEQWQSSTTPSRHILVMGNRYSHKAISEALHFVRHLAGEIKVIGPVEAVPEFSGRGHDSGHLDDVTIQRLMNEASILIFPSLYEGFGYPALEASVLGKPVILHDNPLNRELERAGCLDTAYFFRTFAEIPDLIEQARRAKPQRTGSCIGQSTARMGEHYAATIIEALMRPPSHQLLEERWDWLVSNPHQG